jgi:endoglucanase
MVSDDCSDDFIFSAWGKTIWGSSEDLSNLENDIRLIRSNFTDVPLVIGEWGASAASTEPAARWRYFDFFIRTAAKYNTTTILWDNGADFLDRGEHGWRDPTAIEILMSASKGVMNSLPDSTTDNKATSQFSSAYIFHQSGQQLTNQTLPFLMNGNTVRRISVAGGESLNTQKDYIVSGGGSDGKGSISFTKDFLKRYFSPNVTPGVKANLTVEFSAGASSVIQIVQWDIPIVQGGATSAKEIVGKDLEIPVIWKGLPKLAAVRATYSDGVYMTDDWTKWLGKLQAGYAVSHTNWKTLLFVLRLPVYRLITTTGTGIQVILY